MKTMQCGHSFIHYFTQEDNHTATSSCAFRVAYYAALLVIYRVNYHIIITHREKLSPVNKKCTRRSVLIILIQYATVQIYCILRLCRGCGHLPPRKAVCVYVCVRGWVVESENRCSAGVGAVGECCSSPPVCCPLTASRTMLDRGCVCVCVCVFFKF